MAARARVIERTARELHKFACQQEREKGGEEGIEWVKWGRLPEWAQFQYLRQAKRLAKAGLLHDPTALARAWDEGRQSAVDDIILARGETAERPMSTNPYPRDLKTRAPLPDPRGCTPTALEARAGTVTAPRHEETEMPVPRQGEPDERHPR